MLTQQTVEKLHTLRLRGMAEAFREQEQDPEIHRLSFEERLGLLVDRQWNWKHNQALERRLINARLRGSLHREYQLPRIPRAGPTTSAILNLGIGMGTGAPEYFSGGRNRSWQNVFSTSSGTESVSRRHTAGLAVSRSWAVLFLPVACLVVLMEQVLAKVPCELAPHRMDVVGVVLRVV